MYILFIVAKLLRITENNFCYCDYDDDDNNNNNNNNNFTLFSRDIVCLRNISINTLHKDDDDYDDNDDDDDNNNNNNKELIIKKLGIAFIGFLKY